MNYMIAPSMLAADFLNLSKEIAGLSEGGADLLHFDVMDGQFVPEISFGEPVLRSIRKACSIPVDVHLMVKNPEKQIPLFLESGADRITFHMEACSEVQETIDLIHAKGIPAAVSVKPDTPVETVFPYLDQLEMVLIMTVEPGFGGQAFLTSQLEKIRTLRAEIERRGLHTLIQVDGGINLETVVSARDAGADVFVAGSALFRGNLPENIRKMREVLHEQA